MNTLVRKVCKKQVTHSENTSMYPLLDYTFILWL